VSGAARPHFALWRIWLCARTTSLPFGVRPSVSTAFSTSLKPPSAPARTTTPYNIERLGDDRYQISLAVAGFAPDDISVTAEQNVVTIEGHKADKAEHEYLYRGISGRPFKRQFNLADYVQVRSAAFENGLLKIELFREIPEAMKPRRIAINAQRPATCINSKARPRKSRLGKSPPERKVRLSQKAASFISS
jgi:molecular chaperone IbpA